MIKRKRVRLNPTNNLKFEAAWILTEMRLRKGWTQEVFAKKMGTLQPSIARAESNGCSLSFLQKASEISGFPIKLQIDVY